MPADPPVPAPSRRLMMAGAASLMAAGVAGRADARPLDPPTGARPMIQAAKSVVLVHGAFADGSAWNRVIPLLQAQGLKVISVQNPLTSLADDVAHTRRAIARLEGPIVLVGHSWGGVVITEAGLDDKVSALVYVAAISPAAGESANVMLGRYPPSPGLASLDVDAQGFAVLPPASVAENFAQDLPAAETAVMATTQGPVHAGCFEQPVSAAAWDTKPAWAIVTGQDRMLQPEYLRAVAERMRATVVDIDSSHVPQASRPAEVAAVILHAAAAT